MIKQGYLFNVKAQKPLSDKDFKTLSLDEIAETEDKEAIFGDKNLKFFTNSVNYKYAFKLWANFVCDKESPCISVQELMSIFPEYANRIEMYDKCCNKQGQVVKNKEFYGEYLAKDARHGKRGGRKVKAQKKEQLKKVKRAAKAAAGPQ